MNPSSALGRVAILKNIVAKPELNSRYANIEEYNDDRKRYLLRLIDHITRAPSVSAWVTEDKFDFAYPRIFPDHTDLRELVDNDEDTLLARYHTEQDSLHHPIHTEIFEGIHRSKGTYEFRKKGIVLGASGGGVDENGLYLPKTQTHSSVRIKLDNNTDTLEIEDFYFNLSENAVHSRIDIHRGNVIFRRCMFTGSKGVAVYVEGTNESSPSVVFENCVFKAGYYCKKGYARFINCIFRNCSNTSIIIFDQSSVNVKYCDIIGGKEGIYSEGKQCEISHCSIRNIQNGVTSERGNCFVNDCLISNAAKTAAFASNSMFNVNRCRIEHCDIGVTKSTTGNMCIIDSVFDDCGVCVNIGFDCVGTVTMNGCTLSPNSIDVAHGGQTKCVVSKDGKIVEKNGQNDWSCFDSPSVMSAYIAANPENEYIIRRSLKNAGKSEYSPLCGQCGAQEPAETKFKKCSRCNKTAYCSRECQKAAWSIHKVTCADLSL